LLVLRTAKLDVLSHEAFVRRRVVVLVIA